MNLDGLRVNHAGLDNAAQDLYTAVKEIDDRMNRPRGRARSPEERLVR